MAIRQPRYSKAEFTQRGNALYESKIRPQVEQNHQSQIVAIDIETGEFEIGDDSLSAADDLRFSNRDATRTVVACCPRGLDHRLFQRLSDFRDS